MGQSKFFQIIRLVILTIPVLVCFQNCSQVPSLTALSSEADKKQSQSISSSPTMIFGVDARMGKDTAERIKIANLLKSKNFKSVRIGFNFDNDPVPFREQIIKFKEVGIISEVILFPSYQYISRCDLDPAAVEVDSYTQTAKMVNNLKDIVQDFELTNEVSLRAELKAEVPPNSTDQVSSYYGKSCYNMRASVLRGMANAIKDIRLNSGLPLRIMLGTVGRDFAFVRFMQEKGVEFDLIGYHIYPRFGQKVWETDTWFGVGGLFTQLASFNKKIHVNEFNCGETYDASYDNMPGSALVEDCYRSLKRFMLEMLNQKTAQIESIHYYELVDEPAKAAPENHFGLMYDLDHPKIQLSIATYFNGGVLTESEKAELQNRSLFSF